MNQQINLYQVEKRKGNAHFTFKRITTVFAAYVFFLIVATGIDLFRYMSAKMDFTKTQQIKNQKSKVLGNALQEIEKQKVNEKILANLDFALAENKQKKIFLDILSAGDNQKITPYSSYFESFARRRVDGLWLKKITIQENGAYLSVSGSCSRPMAIMEFMDALKNEQPFAGRVFQLFNLSQGTEPNESIFSLESKQSKTNVQENNRD